MLEDLRDIRVDVLPPDEILRLYGVELCRKPLAVSPPHRGQDNRDDARDVPVMVPPPPINPSHKIQVLNINDRVDVRDLTSGKWRPAEVGYFSCLSMPISFC